MKRATNFLLWAASAFLLFQGCQDNPAPLVASGNDSIAKAATSSDNNVQVSSESDTTMDFPEPLPPVPVPPKDLIEEEISEADIIEWDTLGEPLSLDLPLTNGADTVILDTELGDNPNGRKLRFNSEEWIILEVWESYETSVTIQGEGPHCDLVNWKHHRSIYEKLLPAGEENLFLGQGYRYSDFEQFPPVSLAEMKRFAKKQCEGWEPLIDKVVAIGEYPAAVSLSAFYFKVRAKNRKGGAEDKFVIKVWIPMGC